MPADLREQLFRWYFGHRSAPTAEATVVEPNSQAESLLVERDVPNESRRVTFAELIKTRALKRGAEIWCRSLKRQQRGGSGDFIKGARVSEDGNVVFQNRRFSNPSKLAVAMVNANGGNTEALNGYAYLFVQSDTGLTGLNELRKRFLEGSPAEQGLVEEMLETEPGRGAFGGDKADALEYVRENNLLRVHD